MSEPSADLAFELAIGRALRLGIIASSVCLAAGVVMTLAGYVNPASSALLLIGLWLLMATPAARIVVSAVSYAQRREWVFVVLTLIVLMELAASVVVAFRAG